MKITALAVAVASVSALLMSAAPASASTAKPSPVVYARGNGWHDSSRRPSGFFFGTASGPYVKSLSWQYWGSHGNAYGQGRLETQNPGCTPAYLCPYHGRWISLFLRDVQAHGSRDYFAKLTVKFRRHGSWHHQHLVFEKVAPATVPSWHGPDKFPWF
jgi:hypothetical protein